MQIFASIGQFFVQLYHKLGSPKWFYDITGKWLPWFAIPALVLLVTGSIWGLFYAPVDYQQGDSYRIIFIHVPVAILAQSIYMMMAVAGVIVLVWRMKMAEVVLKCCAPIGASMAFLALVTGAIWGKPTWGTWWVWDARLTSVLILLFLYFGVMALQNAIENENDSARAASVLAIVGSINIPIIKYSVEWWNTLHQPATLKITEESTIHPDMLWPLLLMILGSYCLFAALLIMRSRNEVLLRERKTKWVRNMLSLQLPSGGQTGLSASKGAN